MDNEASRLPLEVFEDRTSSGAAAYLPPAPAFVKQHPAAARPLSPHSTRRGTQQDHVHRAGQVPQYAGTPVQDTPLQGSQLRSGLADSQHEAQALPAAQPGVHRGADLQTNGHGPVRNCHSRAPSGMPYGRNWWGAPFQLSQQQHQQLHWVPKDGTPQQRRPTAQPALHAVQPLRGAPAVVMPPHPASARPRQPPDQPVLSPGPGEQSGMEPRQSRSRAQPVQSPARQKQPAPAQPAPAKQRGAGMQLPMLSQLHREIEVFAQRASPTKVSWAMAVRNNLFVQTGQAYNMLPLLHRCILCTAQIEHVWHRRKQKLSQSWRG